MRRPEQKRPDGRASRRQPPGGFRGLQGSPGPAEVPKLDVGFGIGFAFALPSA